MKTTEDTLTWRGMELRDRSGDKIGTIDEIYEDTETRQPEWALVQTGLFGMKRTFVPLREASQEGDAVTVPYEKSHVKDAPNIDPDGQLSHEEERTLYAHYSIDYTGTSGAGTDRPTSYEDVRADRGRFEREGASGGEADDAMTRSEEELNVGRRREQAGTARLRKYVVTENVETTVPVQREEVRIEREPITDANVGDAMKGAEITESEHEVTLHEERPVVEKEVVPKERVRLEKDTFTEEQTVSEEVRKERIETEGGAREERL